MQKASQLTPMENAARNHSPNDMEDGGWIFLSTSKDNLKIEGIISQSISYMHHEKDRTISQVKHMDLI